MRLKKLFLIFLVIVLGSIVIALIALPYLVKGYINNNGKELCGRQVYLEDLSINYFEGATSLNGLTVLEENEVDTFVFIQDIYVNTDLGAIMQEHYRIEEIKVEGINANVSISDSTFNFQSLIDHFNAENDSLQEKEESVAIKYTLENTQILRSEFSYVDHNIHNSIALNSFNLNLDSLSSERDEIGISTSFHLTSGGVVQSKLNLHQEKGLYELALIMDRLELNILQPYFKDLMYISNFNGQLSTDLRIGGNLNEDSDIDCMGTLNLNQLTLSDTNNIEVVALEELAISIDSLNPLKDRYKLSLIELNHPKIHFEYKDSIDNFSEMLAFQDDTSNSAQEVVESEDYSNLFVLIGHYVKDALHGIKASNFAIDEFALNNFELDFTDHTLLQPFQYKISETTLSAEGIRSDADSLIANLSMLLNKKGEVEGRAILHPKKPEDIEFKLNASKIPLTDFTAYFHYFLGYPIVRGAGEFETTLKVKDQFLTSTNKLNATALNLGKKQKHEYSYNLPVKVGVAMLKNREGNIELDIPVEGNLADPKYKVGKVILNILKELMLKAASSPYNLIANGLKADGDSQKKVSITHLYDSLSIAEYKRLDNLSQVLMEKQELTLIVNPYYNEVEQEKRLLELKRKALFWGIDLNEQTTIADWNKIHSLNVGDSIYVTFSKTNADTLNITTEDIQVSIRQKLKEIHDYLLTKGVNENQLLSILSEDNVFYSESTNKNIQFHFLFDVQEP